MSVCSIYKKRTASFADLDRQEMSLNNQIDTAEENDNERELAVPNNKKRKNDKIDENCTSDKKMSKRQRKREKHAQRIAEAEATAHKTAQTQALSYLSLWKHNKAEWKFNKVKQIWLHKHKFDADKVPEELWQAFIEYFSGALGGTKHLLIEDSKKVIEEMEMWIRNNEDAENKDEKPSELAYKRARDLLQNINE